MSTPPARRDFKLLEFLPCLYFPLLAFMCLAYCWRPLQASDDIWAHAAIGRWISQNHAVPRATLFIWGTPPIPWIYHSWLSQEVFYQLLARGAFWILLFTSFVVITVFALLWKFFLAQLGSTRAPLWMPMVFALAIFCSSLRFHPRPELFTALFLCVLIIFLVSEEANGVLGWKFFAVITLFALWTNFHGAVAIGLLIIWATAICDLLQDKIQNAEISACAKRNLWFAILASAAIFLNPYGFEYWQALKPISGAAFGHIDEWKPFWRAPILDPTLVLGELVLVALAFFAWLGNARKRWAQIAWLVLMSLLFISARRHLWLLPIVALAVLGANAQTLSTLDIVRNAVQSEDRSLRAGARALVIGVLVLLIASNAPPVGNLHQVVAADMPLRAAQFLQRNHPRARVFNDYENSSFLQWQLAGTPPLFIDLLNAYPEQLALDYLDIAHARPRGRKLLDEKSIEVVILRKYEPHTTLEKLAKYLESDKRQWRREYSGSDGTVWARQSLNSRNLNP